MSSVAVVWDLPDEARAIDGTVYCWRSYAQSEQVLSIPRYLEQHAERMRRLYLAFIHELGEFRIRGRRIVDHLDLGDGHGFWWLTQVAEKSPLKSPRIYDCLRLLCLEEMLLERTPAVLTLVSADTVLAHSLGALCASLGIGFGFERRSPRVRRAMTRRVYESLPHTLRALLSLRHVLARWPLRAARPRQWFGGDSSMFICSYFIHLDETRCAGGEFYSRQWEQLPQSVQAGGGRINWLQLFLFSPAVPSVRRGLRWVRRFNATSAGRGRHAFLDSYLTVRRVLCALWLWARLAGAGWRLRRVHTAFRPSGSSTSLWPLLREDWKTSISGPVALANCLAFVLFDAALAKLPRQRLGLYLCENQAWEKSLLRAWRKYGHGEIVGVQHATAPFWHLYYFDDRRSLTGAMGDLPLPDRVAVNGADAWQAFTSSGFPRERLVAVEALRYLQLARTEARRGKAGAVGVFADAAPRAIRVLVLGDIVPASMHHFLQLLECSVQRLPPNYAFTFKPHPGYTADLGHYPALRAGETHEALADLLGSFDIAVAANSTSAAVDAFVAGLPVIIALDGDSLNLSPLRGRAGVRFVGSAVELAEALCAGGFDDEIVAERRNFFFLDDELPRWQQLLGTAGGATASIANCTPVPIPTC